MRKIGSLIRTVCTTMDRLGPSTCKEIADQLEKIDAENVRIYCKRAEQHGLALVDRTVRPFRYTVIQGWQEKTEKPVKEKKPKKQKPAYGCNFVFNLGAYA